MIPSYHASLVSSRKIQSANRQIWRDKSLQEYLHPNSEVLVMAEISSWHTGPADYLELLENATRIQKSYALHVRAVYRDI